jgi:hypothetical protein
VHTALKSVVVLSAAGPGVIPPYRIARSFPLPGTEVDDMFMIWPEFGNWFAEMLTQLVAG